MRDMLAEIRHRIRLKLGKKGHVHNMESSAASSRHLTSSPLGEMYFNHEGKPIHKWIHYLDIYDQHFSRYKGQDIGFLEIGVWKGGSLELWQKFFGPEARVMGIDVDPACAADNVRVGSQDDAAFLLEVAKELGGLDIVLDDGSHVGRHQRISFETLWPLLADDGLYVIEDLHTSYWPGAFEGGFQRKGTGIEFVKELVDQVHGWWHEKPSPLRESIGSIHIYDSIAIIQKAVRQRPTTVKVGKLEP